MKKKEEGWGNITILNVNGLVVKCKEIDHLISEIKPTILIATETHLTEDTEEVLYKIKGYDSLVCYSESRHTGGIVFYTKNDLCCIEMSRNVVQGEWWMVAVKIIKEGKCLGSVVGCYRSPSCSKEKFLNELENWLDEIIEMTDGDFIMAGDFNIVWWKRRDRKGLKLQSIMKGIGCKQIVETSTRVTVDSSTLIDLVFTDSRELKCEVLSQYKMSDHDTILIKGQEVREERQIHMKGKINIEMMRETVKRKFQESEGRALLKDKYVMFRDIVLDSIKLSTGKDKVVRYKPCPWLNTQVRQVMDQKEKTYNKFKMLKSMVMNDEEEIRNAWEEYRKSRNNFVKVWRDEQKNYYEEQVWKNQKDPKKLWQFLKNLYKVKEKIQKPINFDNKIETDSSIIANKLNEYFVNSIRIILDSIPNVDLEILEKDVVSIKEIKEVSSEKVKCILNNMRSTMGADGISVQVMKDSWVEIGDRVTEIVNDSLRNKAMPDVLKQAVIYPTLKVENSNRCEDFRPVNNLPIMEKLIESVIYELLMKHVKENNLLMECQSGFREKHSTESALCLVIEEWKRTVDEGGVCVAIFLDFRRAFETIDRKLLLKKLKNWYGVKGQLYEWIANYLSNRYQQVRYNDCISDELKIEEGVPQGSKLGPLLFLLFVNDLPGILKGSLVHMFADDTLIYGRGEDSNTVIQNLNMDLARVSEWLSANKLCLNVKKTKSMVFGSKKVREKVKESGLRVNNGERIEWVDNFKYLGVIVDEKLKFEEHVEYVRKKVARKLGVIRKIKKTLSKKTKEILFKSIVFPHFKYCSTVLFGCNVKSLDKLQKIFNVGARIVLNRDRRSNVEEMCHELGVMLIRKEVISDILIYLFKIENNMLPKYLQKFLKKNREIHRYGTRQVDQLYRVHRKTKLGVKSMFFEGIRIYNKLSIDIKELSNVWTFRKQVGKWLENIEIEDL